MLLISHRGNIDSPNPKLENKQTYIENTLNKGYDCEIDVYYDKGWWLGHDEPQYKTTLTWLTITHGLWVHCKNIEAIERMAIKFVNAGTCPHFFWHENDTLTLTSRGVLWTFPGKPLTSMSICVLPEQSKSAYELKQFNQCHGVCSNYIANYR